MDPLILAEVKRRRTFAIISHPDAGKTTLTEKLLLYCGAIHEAGEVTAKAHRRKTVSDWMELERQRGISVSSSVLQFEYRSLKVNLLDTPGHQDFSEDTYRTLMATDSAVMVLDVAKGVEAQTLKLFDVCRMRNIPILSFINKMDREGRDPFELLQEIENVLGIQAFPVVWPVGMGAEFRGVYHLLNRCFEFYVPPEKAGQRAERVLLEVDASDSKLLEYMDEAAQTKLVDDLNLLGALGHFDRAAFLAGKQTPVFFGSARNLFGLPAFLDFFAENAPEPQPKAARPQAVDPMKREDFSAFVFKIQANMDKAHRDRVAFMRVSSGKFLRDMDVDHARLEKKVRLAHSKQFMAQDRTTVDEAYAGDILGVYDPGHFQIGDTLFLGPKVEFEGIPQFSPENFGRVRLKDPIKRKQLQKGVDQLCEEGLVQKFIDAKIGQQDPILGVVGVLQFDVLMFRLKAEYGVDAVFERLPYSHARWVTVEDKTLKLESLDLRVPLLRDSRNLPVALFKSDWELGFVQKNAPAGLEWHTSSFEAERKRLSL